MGRRLFHNAIHIHMLEDSLAVGPPSNYALTYNNVFVEAQFGGAPPSLLKSRDKPQVCAACPRPLMSGCMLYSVFECNAYIGSATIEVFAH